MCTCVCVWVSIIQCSGLWSHASPVELLQNAKGNRCTWLPTLSVEFLSAWLSPVSAAPLFEVRGPLATSGVPSAGRKGQTLATSVVGNHRWSFLQPDEARLYLPPPHKAGKRGRRWVMKAREARLSCQQPCRGFPPKVWPPTIDGGFIWFIWNRPGQ